MVTIDTPRMDVDNVPPAVRPYSSEDFRWAVDLLESTGGRYRVRRGTVVDLAALPGLIIEHGGRPLGLLTLARHREALEIAVVATAPTDDTLIHMLIDAAKTYAGPLCRRVYTICSNAELAMQRSLQLYGFRLSACRPGSVEAVARRSAEPLTMHLDGLAVCDEFEYDQLLP